MEDRWHLTNDWRLASATGLARKGDFDERRMFGGMVYIAPEAIRTAAALRAWIRRGLDYVETPPARMSSAKRSTPAKRPRPPAKREHGGKFEATLFRYPGVGGWTFVTVPDHLAPPVTHGWGRTPVHATVDGTVWKTSVWRGKDGRTLLAVPKRVRGAKDDGDSVHVEIVFTSL